MRARVRVVVRIAPPRSPLTVFCSGSLAVHIAVLVLLALWPEGDRARLRANDTWVVGLAAAPGSRTAAGGGGAGSVATPKPESAPAPARLATKIEAPKKPTRDKPSRPEAPEEKKPATAPAASPGAAPSTGGPSPPGGAGPGSGPGGGGGSGIVSMNMGDAQFAWYRDAVVALLTSRWSRPVIEGASGTLSVIVTFDVLRDGRVENVRVDASSGVASLDRSAIRAVEESSPLPPLPPQWDQPMFGARFEFRWTPGED